VSPLGLEVALLGVMVAVFFVGLFGPRDDARRVGVLAVVGLLVLLGIALRTEPGPTLFGGSFVQDELALFAKRLFLVATIVGILGSPLDFVWPRKLSGFGGPISVTIEGIGTLSNPVTHEDD